MQFLNYNKLQSSENGASTTPRTLFVPKFGLLLPGPYALGMQHPDTQSLIYVILHPGSLGDIPNSLSIKGMGRVAGGARERWGRPSQSTPEFLKMVLGALVLQKIFPRLFSGVSTDETRTFPNNVSTHKVCTSSQDGSTGANTRICLN